MKLRPTTIILLALLVGCGDDDGGPHAVDDGGLGADGGEVFGDAAANDAGGGIPDAGVGLPLRPSAAPDLRPGEFGRSEDPDDAENVASCYDGVDNDAVAGFDCDDPNCNGLPSCCIARPHASECCENVLSGNVLANLGDCAAGGSPLGCLTNVSEFGAPTPFVDSGLALGGDGVFDSGLLLDDPIDLRTANLDVEFEIRQAACSGACRESAAIGITTQEALGASSHVDPDIAFVVSGERQQARLLINDDVVRVWDDVGSGAWQIVLRPDGSVLLGRDGEEDLDHVGNYTPSESARLVAWGHSRNPGATGDDGIRIESLNVNVEICDMPRAWSDRTPLTMVVVDEVGTSGSTSPSVIVDDTSTRMAYAQGGSIYLAAQEGARPDRWAREAEPLFLSDETTSYSQPELVFAEGIYHLYYVEDLAEARTWRHTSGDSLDNLVPSAALAEPVPGFTEASIVAISPPDRAERFALVARTDAGIQAFGSVDGDVWTLQSTIPIDLLDASVVAEPSLAVVNHGYQLAVAIRRGARWSVAMFASAELVHWRLVEERALGAGEQTERVGVRDMDLFVRDSMIQAVYVGLDGVRDSLHHTQRPLPTQDLFAAVD